MGDGVEVEVCMHGRQDCLVACVRPEPSTEKGVQTYQTQPDVPPEYRRHRTDTTQSPHYESQDETPPNLKQDGFHQQKRILRLIRRRCVLTYPAPHPRSSTLNLNYFAASSDVGLLASGAAALFFSHLTSHVSRITPHWSGELMMWV